MAKRKDSVALFEVITAAKRKQAAAAASGSVAPSMLRTPKWWFKSKASRARQPQPAEAPEYTAPALPPGYAPSQLAAPVEPPPAVALAASGQTVVQRVALAERATIPEQNEEPNPFGLDIPSATPPSRRRWQLPRFGYKQLALDPNRRELTLRFRYTTAIIAGFALCVAVVLAYVTGRQSNPTAAGAASISSDRVKRGPILPGVLDVNPERDVNALDGSTPQELPSSPEVLQSSNSQSQKPSRAIKGDVEVGKARQFGLNYVVVQSYQDEKTAREAQEALQAAGIDCTVQRGLKDWTDMYVVVGLAGFSKTHSSRDYQQYVRAIEAVEKKFAGKSKIRAFNPLGYQWRPQQ